MAINLATDSPAVDYPVLAEYPLWDKTIEKGGLISFGLEITGRCNNNCRHCYINLPASDLNAARQELTIDEIEHIADEAVQAGALWCTISGGEPLLRKDFEEIYLMLKRKGLLINVFTNGTLITKEIVRLFKKYPPRSLEVSVYGATEETYERVTRRKGSFDAFIRGLNLLRDAGIPVDLKSMIMRSNLHEADLIARFCRERSHAKYRFDPRLHLRYDRDPARNKEIIMERLAPDEIAALDAADTDRLEEMIRKCDNLVAANIGNENSDSLFRCSLGKGDFTVSYDGTIKLCSSLCTPGFTFNLREKNVRISDIHKKLLYRAYSSRSDSKEYRERCGNCPISKLCISCPAHAWLETDQMDKPVEYFCAVAKARASALSKYTKS